MSETKKTYIVENLKTGYALEFDTFESAHKEYKHFLAKDGLNHMSLGSNIILYHRINADFSGE